MVRIIWSGKGFIFYIRLRSSSGASKDSCAEVVKFMVPVIWHKIPYSTNPLNVNKFSCLMLHVTYNKCISYVMVMRCNAFNA